jgi:hypothetical protein
MERNSLEYISPSESELSTIDEGLYTNIPIAEININSSPEYSPFENYLPSYSISSIQNEINEIPLTLPIQYVPAAREVLILMARIREQTSNEAPIFATSANDIDASLLSEQLSVPEVNSTLSTTETWLDPQLQNYNPSSLFETPPLIEEQSPSLLTFSSQNIPAKHFTRSTVQRTYTEPTDDVIFNNIDRIINHQRRAKDGRRMSMLCAMTNGEQRWVLSRELRKDARVSEMLDRYYRDLKDPYWAKRTKKGRKKK